MELSNGQPSRPPESARRREDCPFRVDGVCHHALNYLRPWVCTEYCIVRLDEWVRKLQPGLSDTQVKERVRQLTSGE